MTLTPIQHQVVPSDKWASTCSTGWFPFGMDATIASEAAFTPFRFVLVSLLVFGAFMAYRKYTRTKRAKRYNPMSADEVRLSMCSTPIHDAHTTFSRLKALSSTKSPACFLECIVHAMTHHFWAHHCAFFPASMCILSTHITSDCFLFLHDWHCSFLLLFTLSRAWRRRRRWAYAHIVLSTRMLVVGG